MLRFLPAILLALLAGALAGALLPEPRAVQASTLATQAVSVNSAGSDNLFATGDTITVTVTFGSAVVGHSNGAVAIQIGANSRSATPAASLSCSQSVNFTYTVVAADHDADGITIASNALSGQWATRFLHHCGGPAQQHNHGSPALPSTLASANANRRVNPNDYDADDDGLIEVDSLGQLNAIRYDLDGQGDQDAVSNTNWANYTGAFGGARPGMGCPNTGCTGYELDADLDFDTTGNDGIADAPYAEWTPIGASSSAPYAATFQGNGHTISHLRLNTTGTGNTGMGGITGIQAAGLFGYASGTLEGVGLVNVDIDATYAANQNRRWSVGGLVGETVGLIRSSYVTGAIDITASGGTTNGAATYVGGLAGRAGQDSGTATRGVEACWTDVAITVGSTAPTGNAAWRDYAGGLVGQVAGNAARNVDVTASYAVGAVTDNRVHAAVGGLLGYMSRGTVAASYSTGAATATNGAATAVAGGLIGWTTSTATITASYWDTVASGVADSTPATSPGEGKTTLELIVPAGYSGIYALWNRNVDGVAGDDDPWDFGVSVGSGGQYPILKFRHRADSIALQRAAAIRADYDADDDGLIEVSSLAQLNAIRWDVNGDGAPASGSEDDYRAAFGIPLAAAAGYGAGGCPLSGGCNGYELAADLDFDTDDDGDVDGDDGAYANWAPLPQYRTIFDGNGHTIANLTINRNVASVDWVGLFSGLASSSGVVRSVGLINPSITARATYAYTGALVGNNESGGQIYASYVRGGSVTTHNRDDIVGGLVGRNHGSGSRVVACYALGTAVSATNRDDVAGGLVGGNYSGANITASYAASQVSNTGTDPTATGGLVGTNNLSSVTNGYYDSDIESAAGEGGSGQTTVALVGPTGYTGIYAAWNVDVDNADNDNNPATGGDDPWDFGAASGGGSSDLSGQYPILKFARSADGVAIQRAAAVRTDYDADDDNLIEIKGLAQLDAIRYDLNGDGAVADGDAANYGAAFPQRLPGMGCAGSCTGYELTRDLDFDTDDSGTVDGDDLFSGNWTPLPPYTAEFQGNGHTIANMTISGQSRIDSGNGFAVALFGALRNNALLEGLGLTDVNINVTRNSAAAENYFVGTLAGTSRNSTVRSSYATGTVRVNVTSTGNTTVTQAGGLIGSTDGTVAASWADVDITVTSTSTHPTFVDGVGGLVGTLSATTGTMGSNGHIIASYARGTLSSNRSHVAVGGLVGTMNRSWSTITASYANGPARATAGVGTAVARGLVGEFYVSFTRIPVSNAYWEITTDHPAGLPAQYGEGQTAVDLIGPTDYSGIYAAWNVNVDGVAGDDDPWDFGDASGVAGDSSGQYPILTFGHSADSVALQRAAALRTDYDTDDDGLIEVGSLAQLDAIRYDLNGDGAVADGDAANYGAGFPQRLPGMGCAGSCTGYELAGDLDFDTDDSGMVDDDDDYPNWVPIGLGGAAPGYTGGFNGNGYAIANMTIDATDRVNVGLFGWVNGGPIENVGLTDVDITADYPNAGAPNLPFSVGGLVGTLTGTLRGSYATGTIAVDVTDTGNQSNSSVGGLVGRTFQASTIAASYATTAVTLTSTSTAPAADTAGGLVGSLSVSVSVTASYATGAVSANRDNSAVGGLIGLTATPVTISASYATGRVTATGSNAEVDGLIGESIGTPGVTASYWDTDASGQADDSDEDAPEGKTTTQLVAPGGYTGIYAGWNVNVDGVDGDDDPWDFGAGYSGGSGGQYPILKFGHSAGSIALQRAAAIRIDYDVDDDRLIEVSSLAQLNAIRHDLNGDGANAAAYRAAFGRPLAATTAYRAFGCPLAGGCHGYELTADLDFDTNGDGDVDDSDAYPSWVPIGPGGTGAPYRGRFNGNGHTIANMTIDATDVLNVGLFGWVNGGPIEDVGMTDVDITARYPGAGNVGLTNSAGAVAGTLTGTLRGSYATGSIAVDVTDTGTRSESRAGGLVGGTFNPTTIAASYATAAVTITSVSNSAASDLAGGLVGALFVRGTVTASYASGAVSTNRGNAAAGGLIGLTGSFTTINASYATGRVTAAGGGARRGGLIGAPDNGPTIIASYWDTDASGIGDDGDDNPPEGKTTAALKEPTGYAGIYAGWNLNVDGNSATGDADGKDDPWDFGADRHYPALKYGIHAANIDRQRPLDTNAGADQTVYTGARVTLDGSGSRVRGGGSLAYQWRYRQGANDPAVTLSGAASAHATFTAPEVLEDTTLKFDLEVTGGGNSATDQVKVTILPAQPNELTALTVTAGGNERPLLPAFASSGRNFDTYVGAYTTTAQIVMEAADEAATISFDGDDPVAGARMKTVGLAEGHNRYTIVVTPAEPEEPAEGEGDAEGETPAEGEGEGEGETEAEAEPLEPATYRLNIRRQPVPRLAFEPPNYLLLDEGATATYTVALDTRWLGAEVTVSISSDNPDVTVSPDTVSFRPTDWEPRTIRVTAAGDADGDDDFAILDHSASGGHFDNVYGRLRVEVTDTDTGTVGPTPTPTPGPTPTPTPTPTPEPTPTPGPGPSLPTVAATYTAEVPVDGRTVTITREAGSLSGITLSLPARLDRNLRITIAPLVEGIPLASERYGLGMTAAVRAGATLTVVGAPAGGLEVCLPLSEGLVSEAGVRPLTLVRYGGAGWDALAGAERRDRSVCAPAVSSGVFAAAYIIPQLGPASDLTVAPGDAAGTLILRWTAGMDATRHWVAGIKQSDWDANDFSNLIWTAAASNDRHALSGLDSGSEYVFAVAAGLGEEWSAWTGLARGTPE